jgi:hypothetical protein
MPVIPATKEAEIKKIGGSRPALGKESFCFSMRPHLNRKKLGMVACTCHPTYRRKPKTGGSRSRLAWIKSKTLSPK